MFAELLATGKHKGEGAGREYAGIITRESDRLAHLIDNVLDFARLERGKASYNFAEGRMQEVVERALDRKSTRLNSSHANISYAVLCEKKNTCANDGVTTGTSAIAPTFSSAPQGGTRAT